MTRADVRASVLRFHFRREEKGRETCVCVCGGGGGRAH